jgi:hypothetical protein
MPTTQLSPHFTLAEMTYSQTAAAMGIDNTPPSDVLAELTRTCEMMEKIRAALGGLPITVTSGYRSEAVNKAVGGVGKSQHQTGQACDFICPGFGDPQAICQKLEPMMKDLGIDQLIWEFNSWVHVSQASAPRYMALTIDNSGTRTGIA